jgi:replication fork protection complex subunit Csm3/Swi3
VFPKAKFRDCIKMTEKVGHQDRLRVMRKQWIDESKPRQVVQPVEVEDLDGLEELQTMEREQTGLSSLKCN